ncbi:MAG: EamA family transporter [Oscillospiraceae bacterium]|nr:EamA family transporter [Oscillospiraceae bacterium]
MKKEINTGSALIIIAAVFWGLMGLFVRSFSAYGFSSGHVAALRLGVGALIFALVMLIKDRRLFVIKLRDLPVFLGLGICSLTFFTNCYFRAIELMPLSTAAILLYTSPIWVMLMSSLFFGEKLTAAKLCALVMAFSGCVLVSGLGGGGLSLPALLCGLGAGFGYALYSIFGTIALRRYEPFTVTFYGFVFGALGCIVLSGPQSFAANIAAAPALTMLWFIPTAALVSAVIPYLCYTQGLKTVEAGKASIIATVEPVVATLLGIVLYNEPLGFVALCGIVLVLGAIVVLNIRK